MSNQAHLLHNTTRYTHTIQEFIPESLFKTFQNITRKSQLTIFGFPQTVVLKSVSQIIGTANAKTQNINVIGHKTSFPKPQAP